MLTPGDSVFYTHNQDSPGTFGPVAVEVIRNLGLIPLVYIGAGTDVRNSSLDREIREDFYRSKAAIIVLGKGKTWRELGDMWVLPELHSAFSTGLECLVYRTMDVNDEEIERLRLPVKTVEISGEDDFRAAIGRDLKRLVTPAN
ncbi:MAG: hypothetical protein C4576_10580 [Desulfobacteraceae bacterium]|jgi:hypothetical protein|nr:MAG: hypothetical protein C4576_10580 [Desulfobacteraceae bacterium]